MEPEERARRTFRCDRVRGACHGILETGWQTFILLIAVRVYEAAPAAKATLAAAGSFGMLLTPLTLVLLSRTRLTASRACSLHFACAGVLLLLAACSRSLSFYIATILAAFLLIAQQMPLMVHIYTENYPAQKRGAMLSVSIVLSVIAGALFSFLGGFLLDWNLDTFRWIILVMSLAAFTAAAALARMPSSCLHPTTGRNPLQHLRYAWVDRTFGWMLFVWMLMGLGNLMVVPLRVEYMGNPEYGLNATNFQIALVTAVIPSLVRVFTTHLWGTLFDRMNFFHVRTLLNICFFVAILLFFNSRSIWMLALAGAVFGMGMAGGNIAWSLWVTKFAPADRTAAYMSVHTFFTGVRGAIAPFIGFYLIVGLTPQMTAWIAATLIGISIALLGPARERFEAEKRAGQRAD